MKDLEFASKARLATLFHGDFKSLLQSSVVSFAHKIPTKYYKVVRIVSGAVVVSLLFILKFMKKKHWAFYVLLGIAEILAAFLAEKGTEQRRIILAQ